MANKSSRLLTIDEQWDLYAPPSLNQFERSQHFTLTKEEVKILESFDSIEAAVYFIICYVFLKLKKSLIKFNYQEVTKERQHIMERYFPTKQSPRALPKNRDLIARIENKALELFDYQRANQKTMKLIKEKLHEQAKRHPRQRKLCKTLLNLLVQHRIAIPPYTTLQNIITDVWHTENQRITKNYQRYTSKEQRQVISSLLGKTDKFHRIVTINQDMKNFSNTAITEEITKLQQLKPVFDIAKPILPKLQLPTTTINYYASLIDYYNGYRLNQLNDSQSQHYLLCYTFSRYQMVNDNLLEAIKKRTLDYLADAVQYAKDEAAKQLEATKQAREKASALLFALHAYPKKTIPKKEIHKYIPHNEFLTIAKLLIDDKLDKQFLFWKYIDINSNAIKLCLRQLFLNLDLVIVNNKPLDEVVTFLKDCLDDSPSDKLKPLPPNILAWIKKKDRPYVLDGKAAIFNRLEFLIYENIVHHISTNKLTLKYSIKHKAIEDDLLPRNNFNKNKSKILKNIGYKKLNTPIRKLLNEKRRNIAKLYKQLNTGILTGTNKGIKISIDKNGKTLWRLRPLDKKSDPNDSLFEKFHRRGIVDVIKFVNQRTRFSRSFDSILPKQHRGEFDIMHIIAVALANAIRVGARKMADISDLNESSMLTTEAAYFRDETILAAIDIINKAAAKLPIYKQWYINNKYHGSADGLKLEVELENIMARFSKKYLGNDMGVSGYNGILNYFSITGLLIGTNEYEGSYTFEMAEHQNADELKIDILSVDAHGKNSFNFALFDLTDRLLAPRIPKPHREKFWGFQDMEIDEDYIIKPTKYADEELIIEEWDNVLHMVTSLIAGDAQPSVIIKKLSSGNYSSRTKLALMHYNNLVQTEFLLMYLHDKEFRRTVMVALNRGEHFNGLYRAITILKKGAFRGRKKTEMQIWNHCTRLIASIILYYNSYILNGLYENAPDNATKKYLISLSPSAWIHVNMLGFYQFFGEESYEYIERWIEDWSYQGNTGFVENL